MLSEEEKRKTWRALLLNAAIVLLVLDGLRQHLLFYPLSKLFQFYTVCSNVFLMVVCALYVWHQARILAGKQFFVPSWLRVLRYFATCTVMVTFFVVVLILAPMSSEPLTAAWRYDLLSRDMCGMHLLAPMLGLLTYVRTEGGALTDGRLPRRALAPTLFYAAILLALNLSGTVNGPYPFLRVREQSVWASILWCGVIAALSYGIAWAVWRCGMRFGEPSGRMEVPALPEAQGWSHDGYIINQDCFSEYTYRTIPASTNACGPVAALNLLRRAGREASFPEVLEEMDALHLFRVPGPTHMRVMRAFFRRHLPHFHETKGKEASLAAARESAMGVFRYWEQRVPHFVAYYRMEKGSFRFFNVCDGAEDWTDSMERFVRDHMREGSVRLLWWEDDQHGARDKERA